VILLLGIIPFYTAPVLKLKLVLLEKKTAVLHLTLLSSSFISVKVFITKPS